MGKAIELRGWRTGACALAMAAVCGLAWAELPQSPPNAARATQVRREYGKLPMSFEANRGQSAGAVKFLARGGGYGLFLTGQEAVLTLHSAAGAGTGGRNT